MRVRHLAALAAAGTLVLSTTVHGATATPSTGSASPTSTAGHATGASPDGLAKPAASAGLAGLAAPDGSEHGVGGVEAGVPVRYAGQKLVWKECGEPELRTKCALVRAPRDWNHPDDGHDIEVAISRVEPRSGRADRVVFGNPGGPGAPGLGMAPFLADQPGLSRHLAIGMDPRGTGDSTNVSCAGAPAYTMDGRDQHRANRELTSDASRLIGGYCDRLSHGLLPFVTTEQTVNDMDLVRRLLGFERIDYVGYSGGTWLGAYYQRYFPEHTGRFVLDSNTDFTRPWRDTFEAQPEAFERRFRADFAVWAAKYPGTLGLGNTAAKVLGYYERLRADLARDPIVLELDFGFDVTIDQNALDGTIIGSLYSKTEFQSLASTMTEFRGMWDEQATGGRVAARKRFDRLSGTERRQIVHRIQQRIRRPLAEDAADATFYAITCNDTVWPPGQGYADLVARREGSRYPLIGWTMNQNPCGYWHRPQLSMPVPDGRGVPVTLMVQSAHDPATNARLARDAHRRYAGSRLITVANEGDHGIYGGVNRCADKLVDTFLGTGRAPRTDITCQGEGIPAPQTEEPAPAALRSQPNPLTVIAGLGARLSGTRR